MAQTNELKYVLVTENKIGMGAIHKEAICHLAYATALDSLGVSSYLTSDQIRKYSPKKTTLKYVDEQLEIEVKVPIKRDLNVYELIQKAQEDIHQNFENFLSLEVNKINIIVDQVVI